MPNLDPGRHTIDYMDLAFRQAEAARDRGEVPIGAVLVDPGSGEVLAADHNREIGRAHV